jgi:hypothetical protein
MSTIAAVPVLTLPYWRAVLDKATRNAVQTVLPVIIAAQVGSIAGLDPVNVLWVAGIAALVTLLKAAVQAGADLQVTASTPLALRLADRAVPAAAATLITFVTVDGTGLATVVDWRAALIATAFSALGALAQAYATPAAVKARTGHDVVSGELA